MKKLISACLITFSLFALGTGCRTQARVTTAHHSVGAGVGAH